MKNMEINLIELQELTSNDLVCINGGYAEYNEGYAAGQYAANIIGGALMLAGMCLLFGL